MREVLFRGKSVVSGEWCEGYYVALDNKHHWIYSSKKYFGVVPETVGQFTGLTDTNGKKIFEGDIVRFAKNIYQIVFTVGSFALYDEQGEMISKIGGHNDHCYSFMDLYVECCWEDNCAYDIEVIGNIHDNPELLKGE
jgi:uncharacterized phage protein (TIGR01671 family)